MENCGVDIMSKDIFESNNLLVTACSGSGKRLVQITLKGDATYDQLTDVESIDLAHALLSRVLMKEGYRATD